MSEKVDKQIEQLVERSMNTQSLESPSSNFSAMVMEQINALDKSKVTAYRPLISKPIWVAILVGFILLVSYVIFGQHTSESGWLSFFDFSIITDNKLSNTFSGFKVSKTVLYSVVLFGIMIFIQIPILKNYFNKRLVV